MNLSSVNTRRTRAGLLAVAIVVVVSLAAAFAQTKRSRAAKEFMRDKLELSQRVLEGVATEDYELIIAKGTRLSAMSQEADWRVFENPDYEQQSTVFRRHVDSLVKAARNKDLDAATLAYVRMTMSCVDCHRLVRGKLVASGEGFPFPNGLRAIADKRGRAAGKFGEAYRVASSDVARAISRRTTPIRQN